MGEAAAMAHRSAFLRLGGGMLVVGAIAWLVLSGLHGELPGTDQAAVEHVHGTPGRLVHVLTIVSIAIVAAGLSLVTGTLADPWAAALARAGTMIVVPSAAVLGVGFAIDGFVLAALADSYAATADQAMRAMDVQRADAVVMIIGATSFAFQTLFGLAVAILASSTLVSREYPTWLCWLGVIGGAVWAVAAMLLFSQVFAAGLGLVFLPVAPVAVWMLGIGGLAWQRGSSSITMERPGATMPSR
jgi:hypothetical protein